MYSIYNSSLEKNQMMTPAIGLTSSIVNDKLGNITLEDNSSGLFTMNEDRSAIQTIGGIPIEASLFKITSSDTNINNDNQNAVNKSYCDTNYLRKIDLSTKLTLYKFSLFTTTGSDLKHQLTNVSLKIAGSHITIPIPTTLKCTYFIMFVDFTVASASQSALSALGCTLNSLPGSISSQLEADTRASLFPGCTRNGTRIKKESPCEYKFSLVCPFSAALHKNAYLHFFFGNEFNYTASEEVYIKATKTEPQVNVTIFGI